MNRKGFLSSLAGLGALVPSVTSQKLSENFVIPRYLRAGDTIGITSPAGYITAEEIEPAVRQIKQWGFRVKTGDTIGKKYFGFGGTDDERLRDLQNMLDDDSIKAVMCARGGYGVVRIIDRLDFKKFIARPKWIIGFSDITALHTHINSRLNIATIHSKMCNSFPVNSTAADNLQRETIDSIRLALTGEPLNYPVIPSPYNKYGTGEGALVGGNLRMIESLAGTASDLKTGNAILFVEDTGEYLYNIDRMFWNLKRTGKLKNLNGLVIGGFRIKPDDPGEEFGIPLQRIVLDAVKEYRFPVCFGFPAGHQKDNFALKCGARHRLQVRSQSCVLEEIN